MTLTFLNPSRTSFIFSYLLKRSAKDFSTEFRSANACSFSMTSCWTVWWDIDFSLCSSSVRNNNKSFFYFVSGEIYSWHLYISNEMLTNCSFIQKLALSAKRKKCIKKGLFAATVLSQSMHLASCNEKQSMSLQNQDFIMCKAAHLKVSNCQKIWASGITWTHIHQFNSDSSKKKILNNQKNKE